MQMIMLLARAIVPVFLRSVHDAAGGVPGVASATGEVEQEIYPAMGVEGGVDVLRLQGDGVRVPVSEP